MPLEEIKSYLEKRIPKLKRMKDQLSKEKDCLRHTLGQNFHEISVVHEKKHYLLTAPAPEHHLSLSNRFYEDILIDRLTVKTEEDYVLRILGELL